MNTIGTNPDAPRDDRSVFAALLALYFLLLFPILRANRYYNDDLGRALIGRSGWDATGRPLTNLLMRMLQCYDHAMVDISPLPQIGAIAILAWIGVLIARRYAIGSPWLAALVAFPLGAQPYYLENLSYKFDALSMSLALLFALLPILTLKNDRRGWWLGILSLFASLNFYQAAINAYLVFILLDIVIAQIDEKTPRDLLRQFLSRALQASAAMVIYQAIVGIHINGWVKQKSQKIHSLHELPLVQENLAGFFRFIAGSFNWHWWAYFGPVLIGMALVPVVVGVRYARRHGQPMWVRALLLAVGGLLPVAGLACILGPMLMLTSPLIAPRVLMAVGALLVSGLIVMQATCRRWQRSDRWTLATACMLALGMVVFASAYGNALGEQKNYEDRIATRLADDLSELRASRSIHSFLIDGTAGYSPATAHVIGQFPIVQILVPTYISDTDSFHTPMFFRYYIADVADLQYKPDATTLQRMPAILAKTCLLPATRSTSAYDLYLVDDTAVVMFRSHPPHCGAGKLAVGGVSENIGPR
jgi:hypothetical protein